MTGWPSGSFRVTPAAAGWRAPCRDDPPIHDRARPRLRPRRSFELGVATRPRSQHDLNQPASRECLSWDGSFAHLSACTSPVSHP